MIGVAAQLPFSGSSTATINLNQYMSGLWFSNDGSSDLTVQINSDIFTVKASEVFDEYLPNFNKIVITNAGGSAFRGYVRG